MMYRKHRELETNNIQHLEHQTVRMHRYTNQQSYCCVCVFVTRCHAAPAPRFTNPCLISIFANANGNNNRHMIEMRWLAQALHPLTCV